MIIQTVNKEIPFWSFLRDSFQVKGIGIDSVVSRISERGKTSWLAVNEQRFGRSNWANANPPISDPESPLIPRSAVEGYYRITNPDGTPFKPEQAIQAIAKEGAQILDGYAKGHRYDGLLTQLNRTVFENRPTIEGLEAWDLIVYRVVHTGSARLRNYPDGQLYREETRAACERISGDLRFKVETGIEERPIPEIERQAPINPISPKWSDLKDARLVHGMRFMTKLFMAGDPLVREALPYLTGRIGVNDKDIFGRGDPSWVAKEVKEPPPHVYVPNPVRGRQLAKMIWGSK